jgi:serine/threonine protein kinase
MSETHELLSGLSMPFRAGALVAGKYRIERPLGQGGMGYVVLARHVQLDQPVALKFMHAWRASESPEGAARFLDEARAAARIRSDHVARVSDTGTLEDGSPYMVMEYLEGKDLEALLQERRRLPVPLAIAYAMQASEGLGEAHAAGIIHRDLKPSNLFLARQTDGSVRLKLLDFGISKMAGVSSGSSEIREVNSSMCGSPLYMAPEQMRSSGDADQRADIWAMGVVLYEMLAATPPFVGDTVPEICAHVVDDPPVPLRNLRADVPPLLEAAVMQCLEKDPQRRFQSVTALARALAPFGTPEARAAAARIERIARGREPRADGAPVESTGLALVPDGSLTRTSFRRAVDQLAGLMGPAVGEPPGSSAATAVVSPQVTQTKASFSRAIRRPILTRVRGKPLAFAAAGAAAVLGIALLIARTKPFERSSPSAAPAAASAVTAPTVATPPMATAVPIATATPTAAMTTAGPAAAAPQAPSPEPPPPTPAAATAAGRRSRPTPVTPSKAAPIGTSGFGGRE